MVSQRRPGSGCSTKRRPDNTEAAFMPSPSGFMLGDYPTDDVACPKYPSARQLLVCQTAGQFVYDGDGLFERNPSPECGFRFDIIASADEILLFNIPEDACSSTLNTSHVLDRTGPWGCLEDAPGLTKYRGCASDTLWFFCRIESSSGLLRVRLLRHLQRRARRPQRPRRRKVARAQRADGRLRDHCVARMRRQGACPRSVCTTGALARLSDGTS